MQLDGVEATEANDSEYLRISEEHHIKLTSQIDGLYEIYVKRNKDRRRTHDSEMSANNLEAEKDALKLYKEGVESVYKEKKNMLSKEDATKLHEKLKKEALEKVCRGIVITGELYVMSNSSFLVQIRSY